MCQILKKVFVGNAVLLYTMTVQLRTILISRIYI
jgi:hypothetical protein